MPALPDPDTQIAARDAAAGAGLEHLERGQTIGLGSGRAVWRFIERISDRWAEGAALRAVVASDRTAARAREAGIEVLELDGTLRLDVAFDGADEVDPAVSLLKGAGGALLREKLVINAADRFIVLAETAKKVERLGQVYRLPVEVARFAWPDTARRVGHLVEDPVLRADAFGTPYVTEEGNLLLDAIVPGDREPAELSAALKATTGVVDHGLFLGLADLALLGRPDGSVERLQRG